MHKLEGNTYISLNYVLRKKYHYKIFDYIVSKRQKTIKEIEEGEFKASSLSRACPLESW